jgi:tuberculosinol/isotuberculosinol synthase
MERLKVTFEDFLSKSTQEVAGLVRESGPLVCVFPINGTRRWFLLEYPPETWESGDFLSAYLQSSIQRQVELFRLFFDHGVDTLMLPVFGPDLLERGEGYLRMATHALHQLVSNPVFLDFYRAGGVRVRFYGDYRRYLKGTLGEELIDPFDQLVRETAGNNRCRLLFGVFGHDAAETIGEIAVRYFQENHRLPDKRTLVERYYGEYIPPVSLFIGFDKFSAFDMPLVATGSEDLYFTVSPSPYLTQRQLRGILYDHLYARRMKEPEYETLPVEAIERMRAFYTMNLERTLGVGFVRDRFWYPLPQVEIPVNFSTAEFDAADSATAASATAASAAEASTTPGA